MGDRANVVVHENDNVGGEVFLYTHHGGTELPDLVRRVLARRARWDDPAYLARMIFSEMIKGNIDGETGYGISATLGDNQHPLIVVDCTKHQVRLETEGRRVLEVYSFEEFYRQGVAE